MRGYFIARRPRLSFGTAESQRQQAIRRLGVRDCPICDMSYSIANQVEHLNTEYCRAAQLERSRAVAERKRKEGQ